MMMKAKLILPIVVLLFVAMLSGCYAPQGKKPEAEPMGVVTGKISDKDTDMALAAELTFPYEKSLQGAVSDPESGLYKLELPVGIHRMRVSKDGYSPGEVALEIPEGRTILKDITLERKRVAKGILTGKVSDASTGEALGAMIRFSGTNIPPTASDLKTGIYRTEIPPGTYVVTVEAQGYVSVSAPVVVEDGTSVIQHFELRKK
jgi:hypothetical protein